MDNEPLIMDFIRHGQTLNPDALNGRSDIAIDPAYDEVIKKRLIEQSTHWTSIVSSPLSRCAHYANWLSEQKSLPITIINELSEFDFGDWDGKKIAEIAADFPKALEGFYRNPEDYPPPNGETVSDFNKRVKKSIVQLADTFPKPTIGIISHAGVMRSVISEALKTPYQNTLAIKIDYLGHLQIKLWTGIAAVWQITQLENLQ